MTGQPHSNEYIKVDQPSQTIAKAYWPLSFSHLSGHRYSDDGDLFSTRQTDLKK